MAKLEKKERLAMREKNSLLLQHLEILHILQFNLTKQKKTMYNITNKNFTIHIDKIKKNKSTRPDKCNDANDFQYTIVESSKPPACLPASAIFYTAVLSRDRVVALWYN